MMVRYAAWLQTLRCRLKGGHDMNMTFPDPNSLGWEFECSRCHCRTTDMHYAAHLLSHV